LRQPGQLFLDRKAQQSGMVKDLDKDLLYVGMWFFKVEGELTPWH